MTQSVKQELASGLAKPLSLPGLNAGVSQRCLMPDTTGALFLLLIPCLFLLLALVGWLGDWLDRRAYARWARRYRP